MRTNISASGLAERQVLELAKICGWRTAHFRPAKTSKGWRTPVSGDGAGLPDLILVRPPEIVFAESRLACGGRGTSRR
jgi:hypothetical protein